VAGAAVLIGRLADAWAPQIAEQYLLDNVLAAEGIAKCILREEIGAACFNAHAHTLLGRSKFCQPGYGAAYGRCRDQDGRSNPRCKMRGAIELGRRDKRHEAPGGPGHLVACPLSPAESPPSGLGVGDTMCPRAAKASGRSARC
jgi:hypothetical protein